MLEAALGQGGEILHSWLGEARGQKILREVFGSAGCVVTSRAIYDGTEGWGDEPPFGMPVVVVTHRAHEPVTKGATSFIFVTGGIEEALARAAALAGDKMVHVMGGASIIQQALNAGLVDELQLHVAPVLLGAGVPLFEKLRGSIRLERIECVETEQSTHLKFKVVKSGPNPAPAGKERDHERNPPRAKRARAT